MTRKDFKLIAKIITNIPEPQREAAAVTFAANLKILFPNFKPETFLVACRS